VDINNVWESIRENMKASAKKKKKILGYYELKQHKALFIDKSSKIISSKEAGHNAVVAESKSNGYNLNNVRRETSRITRKN